MAQLDVLNKARQNSVTRRAWSRTFLTAAVMYLGQIVEMGTRGQVFSNPRHPYTRRLIEAVPVPDPKLRRARFARVDGEIPSAVRPVEDPSRSIVLRDVGEGHLVADQPRRLH